MTKEELKQEARRFYIDWERRYCKESIPDLLVMFAEPREKRISELEEKISVLLSCKNCPENKGGFICVKEYEGKCLAQKIQYTKELKEENKVLAQNLEDTEIINAKLKKEVEKHKWNNIFLEDCAVYDKKIAEEYTTLQERIKRLEKENAELKEKYDTCLRENTGLKIHNAYVEKKLTKAKELLNMFLRLHYNPIVDEHTLFCKVEQFLNSEVVE